MHLAGYLPQRANADRRALRPTALPQHCEVACEEVSEALIIRTCSERLFEMISQQLHVMLLVTRCMTWVVWTFACLIV